MAKRMLCCDIFVTALEWLLRLRIGTICFSSTRSIVVLCLLKKQTVFTVRKLPDHHIESNNVDASLIVMP